MSEGAVLTPYLYKHVEVFKTKLEKFSNKKNAIIDILEKQEAKIHVKRIYTTRGAVLTKCLGRKAKK